MKINYFDLLSPSPIYIENTCSVISPKLRDIASIGYDKYQLYILFLLMDVKTYLNMIGCAEQYDQIAADELSKLKTFDLLIQNEQTALFLGSALDFFIKEKIIYSKDDNCYIAYDESTDKEVGRISDANYNSVCNIICKRNNYKFDTLEDLSKIKNKKALEIAKKLQKGRKNNNANRQNKDLELGNIISAVANKSLSLNISNIWDITVFQLWDCFARLSNNNIYDIQSMSVATWGDKDNHFDASLWFKTINEEF